MLRWLAIQVDVLFQSPATFPEQILERRIHMMNSKYGCDTNHSCLSSLELFSYIFSLKDEKNLESKARLSIPILWNAVECKQEQLNGFI